MRVLHKAPLDRGPWCWLQIVQFRGALRAAPGPRLETLHCNRAHPTQPVGESSESHRRCFGGSLCDFGARDERCPETFRLAADVGEPRRPRDCRRHPCRLGPQGNPHRRDRDARPDGDPRGIREEPAAEGRAHHRLASHDDPDRRAGRDSAGARRASALGLVQHLLDPGPRRRGAGSERLRRCRYAGLRLQGRVARRLLGLHAPDLRVRRQGREGRRPEHDPRRRRRRDLADAPRQARREGPVAARESGQRGRDLPVRRDQGQARDRCDLVHAQERRDPRRDRRDDDRRAPPERDEREGHACCSARSTSTIR